MFPNHEKDVIQRLLTEKRGNVSAVVDALLSQLPAEHSPPFSATCSANASLFPSTSGLQPQFDKDLLELMPKMT